MNAEAEMCGADGLGADPLKTQARDAEIVFHPGATEEERGDAVAELLRLAANMEHPAVLELAVYDDLRDVELSEELEGYAEEKEG